MRLNVGKYLEIIKERGLDGEAVGKVVGHEITQFRL